VLRNRSSVWRRIDARSPRSRRKPEWASPGQL